MCVCLSQPRTTRNHQARQSQAEGPSCLEYIFFCTTPAAWNYENQEGHEESKKNLPTTNMAATKTEQAAERISSLNKPSRILSWICCPVVTNLTYFFFQLRFFVLIVWLNLPSRKWILTPTTKAVNAIYNRSLSTASLSLPLVSLNPSWTKHMMLLLFSPFVFYQQPSVNVIKMDDSSSS